MIGDKRLGAALLLSLLVTMHDRFAPVGAVRAEHHRADPEPAPAVRA